MRKETLNELYHRRQGERGRHHGSITRIGEAGSPWSSVTAGLSRRMPSRTRCSIWPPGDTGASPHDRRGHGRSSQPWTGNDMDTYADDLAALVQALDLKDAIHVGHSTGGGEVARYIGRHGTSRVAKAVLIGAVPPPHAEDRGQPRRSAHGGLRRHPGECRRRPVPVLERAEHAFLRVQQAGRRDFGRGARILLAPGNDDRLSRPPTSA